MLIVNSAIYTLANICASLPPERPNISANRLNGLHELDTLVVQDIANR